MLHVVCGTCNGTGEVNTGALLPWGAWADDECPTCLGLRSFYMAECEFLGECCVGVDIWHEQKRDVVFAIDSDKLVKVSKGSSLELCDHITKHYANCY